jgi:hypothetical protein
MNATKGEAAAAEETANGGQGNVRGQASLAIINPNPQRTDPEPDSHDFDWLADAVDIVIPEQPETAVYVNTAGAIVIRQRADYDDDPIIRIRPECVGALIARLRRVATEQP